MSIFEAIIIAIIEGLTEFLPVSSTGHMIITSSLLNIEKQEFTKMFEVVIQLGAILAVVVLYRKKFFSGTSFSFYTKLAVAVLPAIFFGLLFSSYIKEMMESNLVVALTLLIGGFILLFIDNVFRDATIEKEEDIRFGTAFMIGLWQVIAMVPGVSRSAASIIGGMQQKLTRKLAAEFSFYLAVPTMFAATSKDLFDWYRAKGGFTGEEIQLLLVGNVVAFIVAILAIKFFIGFLQKYGFRIFGIYRIALGILLLVLIYMGYLD